ncbi:TPA: hypothetical protein ACRNCS_001197 [Pseudomonas aeruginosa]
MQWSTSCKDWESKIEAGKSLVPLKPIFQDEADEALDVFCNLRMVDATGSPLMGETCRPWVLDLVAALFGSYDAEQGRTCRLAPMQDVTRTNVSRFVSRWQLINSESIAVRCPHGKVRFRPWHHEYDEKAHLRVGLFAFRRSPRRAARR